MTVKNFGIDIEIGVANRLLTNVKISASVEITIELVIFMTRTFPRTSQGSEPNVPTNVFRITEPANRFKDKASNK